MKLRSRRKVLREAGRLLRSRERCSGLAPAFRTDGYSPPRQLAACYSPLDSGDYLRAPQSPRHLGESLRCCLPRQRRRNLLGGKRRTRCRRAPSVARADRSRSLRSVFAVVTPPGRHHLALHNGRTGLVVRQRHRVAALPAGHRVQPRLVAGQLRHRRLPPNPHRAGHPVVGAADQPAARRQVAGDVAHRALRRRDLHVHDGLEQDRPRLGLDSRCDGDAPPARRSIRHGTGKAARVVESRLGQRRPSGPGARGRPRVAPRPGANPRARR